MTKTSGIKSARLLEIYSRLQEGEALKKAELAQISVNLAVFGTHGF